ncbi:MAG: phosphatidylglycerophosphatase and protein-tyrosine phosphatase 1 family protein [Planctomycetota bacterium]
MKLNSQSLRRLYARGVFYPTLLWNWTLAHVIPIRRWWDSIDAHVIVGAFPFAHKVPAMSDAGVRAVVNTCEEYCGPIKAYERHGIEQFHMPTTDFTHPQIEDVRRAVDFIQSHVERGHVVYIHCKAGRARSATVAMAWLMAHREMTPDEAQRHLLDKRPHVNPNIAQRPVIQTYATEQHG